MGDGLEGMSMRRSVMMVAVVAAVGVGSGLLAGLSAAAAGSRPANTLAGPAAGSTWGQAEPVPGLAALNQGHSAYVISVSCRSAGNCGAGGDYNDAAGHTQAFVVGEVKGVWGTAEEAPGLGARNQGGIAQIRSVSCGAAAAARVGFIPTPRVTSRRSSSTRRTAGGAGHKRYPAPRP